MSGSFGAKYLGIAVEGFYEYLTENERLFKSKDTPKYYAKFCSNGKGIEIARTSIAQGQEGSAFLVETY